MEKRKEESIGEKDEPKLERLELRFLPEPALSVIVRFLALLGMTEAKRSK